LVLKVATLPRGVVCLRNQEQDLLDADLTNAISKMGTRAALAPLLGHILVDHGAFVQYGVLNEWVAKRIVTNRHCETRRKDMVGLVSTWL
jgi:hypothetical protein